MTTIAPLAAGDPARATNGRPRAETEPAQQAARMLEGLFVRQLVRALGQEASQSALFGKSLGRNIYQEMFQGALADQIQAAGGIGLAAQLEAQLRANTTPRPVGGMASAAAAAPTARSQPIATRSVHPVAATVAQARGRQALVATATAESGRTLQGVAYAAPARRAQSLPRDADGRLAPPLAGSSSAGDRWTGTAGQRVSAAASGRVLSASATALVLQHAGGRTTHYHGLGRVDAQPGDLVLRGQALGTLGPAKILRFSVEQRGAPVDLARLKRLFLSP